MDDHRFDRWTRSLASGISRRRLLSAAGLSAGWLSLSRPQESGAQDDRDDGVDIDIVGVDDDPCTLVSCPPDNHCVAGACCPNGQICGETCCPPETIGCTAPVGPGGSGPVSCLCPGSLGYDPQSNTCPCLAPGELCSEDGDCCGGYGCAEFGICGTCASPGDACGDSAGGLPCCSGTCVDGTCGGCADIGEACRSDADCCVFGATMFDQVGSASGRCDDGICHCCTRTKHKCHREIGLCCEYPLVSMQCCEDHTDCSTCAFIHCCTPGVDCPGDRGAPECPTPPMTESSITSFTCEWGSGR